MEKIGLGPDHCLKINPKLIYARLTGFGQDGPYALMAGHDTNYLALTGVLSTLGRSNELPSPPGNFLADFAGGTLMCAWGIVMCLYEREKSGKGQVIDCAMVDGLLYLGSFLWQNQSTDFWNKPRGQNIIDGGAPYYEIYETKDGKWFSIGALEPQFFAILISKLGLSDQIKPNDQFNRKKWPEMRRILTDRLKSKTRDEWTDIFAGTDACAVPVLTLLEVKDHPHNSFRKVLIRADDAPDEKNIFQTFAPRPAPRLSRTPGRDTFKTAQNPLGYDTVPVLKDFGLSSSEITELLNSKVVSSTQPKL